MNKKILLAAFSLFLIISINQAIAADPSEEEPQQILDARSLLKTKSDILVAKHPEFAELIADANSKMNTITYTGITQPYRIFLQTTTLTTEEQEQALNEIIQKIAKAIKDVQERSDSFTKLLAIMPEDMGDFFRLSSKLYMDIFELAKQNLETQLSKVREGSASKQEL